jgi:hypothetical protein
MRFGATDIMKPVSTQEEIKVGMKVKDLASGFEGIAQSKTYRRNGWVSINIQPYGDGTTLPELQCIDWQTITILDEGFSGSAPEVGAFLFNIGDKVYDPVTQVIGTVTSNVHFMNGCLFCDIIPPVGKDGDVKGILVPQDRLQLKESVVKPKAEEKATKSRGGPSMRLSPMA